MFDGTLPAADESMIVWIVLPDGQLPAPFVLGCTQTEDDPLPVI